MPRRTPLGFLTAALLLAFATTPSFGAPVRWNNALGGNWNVPANWLPAAVPTATDTAIIDLAGTYTVTVNQNLSIAGLRVNGSASGVQTITATSRTMTFANPVTIGEQGVATFTSCTINGAGAITNRGSTTLASSTVAQALTNHGTLIASGRAGWRTEELEPRDGPALACLGIETVLGVRESVRGAYLELGEADGFPRLRDTDLVFLDGPFVDARYRSQAERRLRLIPPGPFGPPERCVLPEATGEPGLVIDRFGAGRALYVPWMCGTLVDRYGFPNTSSFVADVVLEHAEVEAIGGNLSPLVEVTWLRQGDGDVHLLHLVNGSGGEGTTCVAPVKMRDVEVIVPFAGEPSRVSGLVVGRDLEWRTADGRLAIQVPELELFEAITVESSCSPLGPTYGNVVGP